MATVVTCYKGTHFILIGNGKSEKVFSYFQSAIKRKYVSIFKCSAVALPYKYTYNVWICGNKKEVKQ